MKELLEEIRQDLLDAAAGLGAAGFTASAKRLERDADRLAAAMEKYPVFRTKEADRRAT